MLRICVPTGIKCYTSHKLLAITLVVYPHHLHKGNLNIRQLDSEVFESFEYSELLLKSNSKWIRIIIRYRPPSQDNHLTVKQFLNDFSSFLERQILLLQVGDFNVHVDDKSDYYANLFQALIQNVGLIQHIHQATHGWSHLGSDYIKRDSILVSHIHVTPPWVSDHCIIHFKLTIPKPTFSQKTIGIQHNSNRKRD